ncbi:hypothetical protein [Actinoplanes sp. NPDC049118]|uniref:hypothetical protein n=1 Tax=Actinoplanes sp. NPDC049118 TaxID=3155769 RepID=UPI0033C910D9
MVQCFRDADGARAWSHCGRQTAISTAEYATLRELRDRLCRVVHLAACELATGHKGRHVAFVVAAQQGDHWWWLRWGGQRRELVRLELCDRTTLDEDVQDDCLLPAGHPGPHSFEL